MINRAMNIIVTEYDENCVQLFKTEATKIQDIFKNDIVEIPNNKR